MQRLLDGAQVVEEEQGFSGAQTHVLRIGDVMPQSFSSFSSSRVEVSGLPNSSVALNNLFVLLFFVVLMQSDCSFLQSSRVLHFFQSIC